MYTLVKNYLLVATTVGFILLSKNNLLVVKAFSHPGVVGNNNHKRWRQSTFSTSSSSSSSSTSLYAIGALAKKAKQMELKKYVEGGMEDSVKEKIKIMKEGLNKDNDDSLGKTSEAGPLQAALTKRKGTITVIAEYKRKMNAIRSSGGYISEVFDPEVLSPMFREFGASGIAVMADERMGGCTYEDLKKFVIEQRRARMEVPGPVPVINNDLIVDELQIARTAAYDASACVIQYGVIGNKEQMQQLLTCCRILNIEAIVSISTKEELQHALDIGATMIMVEGIEGADEKANIIADMSEQQQQSVCTIANIFTNNDNQLREIEEAWALRDKGFNCAWISEALYKGGNDETEHPGAIIQSMKSKSSLRWASPKASSGRGEGAREYLGDILM